jgi:hypothetical protein
MSFPAAMPTRASRALRASMTEASKDERSHSVIGGAASPVRRRYDGIPGLGRETTPPFGKEDFFIPNGRGLSPSGYGYPRPVISAAARLGDGEHRRVGIGRRDGRHDGRVRHPQAVHAADPQLKVDHRPRIRARAAGADRMEVGGHGAAQERAPRSTSCSILTVVGDDRTWSVVVYISSRDHALKALRQGGRRAPREPVGPRAGARPVDERAAAALVPQHRADQTRLAQINATVDGHLAPAGTDPGAALTRNVPDPTARAAVLTGNSHSAGRGRGAAATLRRCPCLAC